MVNGEYFDYNNNLIPKKKTLFYYETGIMGELSRMKFYHNMRHQKHQKDMSDLFDD